VQPGLPSRIQVHQLIAVQSLECTSCQSCVAACPKRADALHLGTQGQRLAPRQLLGLLCLLLLVLPLLSYGLLDLWSARHRSLTATSCCSGCPG
jgi:ferredoxin